MSEEQFLLAEYFEGISARDALKDPRYGVDAVISVLDHIRGHFDRALQPSSRDAALSELRSLCDDVLQINYWTAADRAFLSGVVFPLAEERLISDQPTLRATNGDFTLGNILVGADGAYRVVDYEQAVETHFHFEDWLRVTQWESPTAVRDYALTQLSDAEAARLCFLLRQIAFEARVVRAPKVRKDIGHWAGELRAFAIRSLPELRGSLLWPQPEGVHSSPSTHRAVDARENSFLELFHYARHMGQQVGRNEAKIRQMQESFSWRSTAWLRALRRSLLDRRRITPSRVVATPPFPFAIEDFVSSKAARLHHHLDTSEDDIVSGTSVLIEGWVFAAEPPRIVQVRARTGQRIHAGTYGLERPEIADKFLPQAYSRFQLPVTIEPGDTRIQLDAMTEEGEWLTFYSKSLAHSPEASPSWAAGVEAVRSRYQAWVRLHDTLSADKRSRLQQKARSLPSQPLVSIIMPVYNAPERWLDRAIESVREQVYQHWELCIADDASPLPHVRRVLERHAKTDSRIKVVYRGSNGHISAASNSALEIVSGDFVGFLDHDDELPPHALYCFVEFLSRHADAEVIYSDEDKIAEDGTRFDPHFKPDWNPALLRSQNYLSHLTLYRTSTVRALGGLRIGFEGCQDWDLSLRVTERVPSSRIHHLPRVLYHWRAIEGSTAAHLRSKDYATDAAKKTLEDHSQRIGANVALELVKGSHWRATHALPAPPPLVTMIIPTRNRSDLLIRCIESLYQKTGYANFEVLIADNDSDEPELHRFYERMEREHRFTILPCSGPFNFSAINNRAARQAKGEILAFMNNDLEVLHKDWLSEMVGHAVRPEIGVVGAKLYYPDFRLQHAGVITGLGGVAGHAFKHFPKNDPGTPQFRPHVTHNVTAVTAACALVRKSVFDEVGGFDEKNLKVAFNDVDFCLRVQSRGYLNLFTPFAELIHHESASRGYEDTPEKAARFAAEVRFMKERWGERLLNDPAYNPNLTLDTEDFAYAFPPRTPTLL